MIRKHWLSFKYSWWLCFSYQWLTISFSTVRVLKSLRCRKSKGHKYLDLLHNIWVIFNFFILSSFSPQNFHKTCVKGNMPPELDANKKRVLQIKNIFQMARLTLDFTRISLSGVRPPVKLAATSLKLSVSTCDHCGYNRSRPKRSSWATN